MSSGVVCVFSFDVVGLFEPPSGSSGSGADAVVVGSSASGVDSSDANGVLGSVDGKSVGLSVVKGTLCASVDCIGVGASGGNDVVGSVLEARAVVVMSTVFVVASTLRVNSGAVTVLASVVSRNVVTADVSAKNECTNSNTIESLHSKPALPSTRC